MAIGSTLRPELGRMDFSGIERGGRAAAEAIMLGSERLGAGIQSAGASIGGAIKERGEMKANISAAQKWLDVSKDMPGMNPQMLDRLDRMKTMISDEELPLSQRNAIASQFRQVAQTISLAGMERMMPQEPKYEFGKDLLPMEGGGFGVLVTDNQGNVSARRVPGVTPQPDSVSLQQGGSATLSNGKTVDTVFNPRTGQFMYSDDGGLRPLPSSATPGTPTINQPSRDEAIQIMMDEYGITRMDAASIQDGVSKIVTDPVSGQTMLVNQATGKARKVEFTNPQAEQAITLESTRPDEESASEDQISLWDIANSSTTGVLPAIEEAAQKLTGSLTGGSINLQDPEIAVQRQQFLNAQQRFIRALSLNRRYPTTEQERLRKELGILPSAFTDPQTLRARIIALDSYLNNEIDILNQSVNDPNTPVDQQREDSATLKDVINFKRILGVPKATQPSAKPSNLDDDIAEVWDYLSEEDKQKLGVGNQ